MGPPTPSAFLNDMTQIRFFLSAALLLVAAPLFLAACDGSDVDLGDVNSLLTDARIARQAGDLDGAINLLESALDQDAENVSVRVELASAYMERNDVDLLDLDRIALYLTSFEDNFTESDNPQAVGKTCQYDNDPNAHPFELSDYEEYLELYEVREAINEVLALLNGTDPTGVDLSIIPEELRALSLCSGISDGELDYDREGALAAMQAIGLTDDEITTALAVNAVGRFLEAYFFITEDIPQEASWFQIKDENGDYIGVCADDPDALREQVETAIEDLGEAITSLDLRDHVLGGNTTTRDLVEHVIEAYEAVEEHLGPYCGE